MIVEIINTGSELMLGRVLNTHQQWLCRQLADLGMTVSRQTAIPDTGQDIQQAVRESLSRADVILVTGGLGPTSDDVTRQLIAELLDRPLRENSVVARRIRKRFEERKRPMPPSVMIQAQVPKGARVLPNNNGTAPGLAMKTQGSKFRPHGGSSLLIMLPGPPRELQPMFLDSVVPMLELEFPNRAPFACQTWRTTGLGESVIEERIARPLATLVKRGLQIGYCARFGEVEVRFVSRTSTAENQVRQAGRILRGLIGKSVYAMNDEPLEAVVVRLLAEHKKTLVVAESCTGGFIANRITNVPGASAGFLGGWVTYSNQAKQACLGVSEETLTAHGAVSDEVVREMAEGALERSGADFAIAVTGIAGPSGGTPSKPVGTVFIALASSRRTVVLNPINRFDRESFKFATSQQALDLLRRMLKSRG